MSRPPNAPLKSNGLPPVRVPLAPAEAETVGSIALRALRSKARACLTRAWAMAMSALASAAWARKRPSWGESRSSPATAAVGAPFRDAVEAGAGRLHSVETISGATSRVTEGAQPAAADASSIAAYFLAFLVGLIR